MNIDAFTSRDLQTIQVFLDLAGAENITDVGRLSQVLAERREAERQEFLNQYPDRPAEPPPPPVKIPLCPECGSTPQRALVEGELIIICKKCRWSTLIPGGIHGRPR